MSVDEDGIAPRCVDCQNRRAECNGSDSCSECSPRMLPGNSGLCASIMADAKAGVRGPEAERAWRRDVGRMLCMLGVRERKIRSVLDAMAGAP